MISVLLPTYNSATTLYSSIMSILHQTWADFELLILNDGNDPILESISTSINDSRIKYHSFSRQGLTKTLNSGLELAQYDIIARMDDDDLCIPWRFERQLKELTTVSVNTILSSWYGIFTENSLQYIVRTPTESCDIKKGLLLHSYISHPGLMCYKRTLIENGGYVNKVEIDAFQDYETWLEIKNKIEFAVIPEVLIYQRYRKKSLSNNMEYKQNIMYQIQKPYYEDLKKTFDITNITEEYIYRGWREYFYGDKNKSREYWIKINFKIIKYPRIMIAWVMSYLPIKYLVWFKELRVKYRLLHLIMYFSPETKYVRWAFKSIIESKKV